MSSATTRPPSMSVPTTKIMAIETLNPSATPEQMRALLPQEAGEPSSFISPEQSSAGMMLEHVCSPTSSGQRKHQRVHLGILGFTLGSAITGAVPAATAIRWTMRFGREPTLRTMAMAPQEDPVTLVGLINLRSSPRLPDPSNW